MYIRSALNIIPIDDLYLFLSSLSQILLDTRHLREYECDLFTINTSFLKSCNYYSSHRHTLLYYHSIPCLNQWVCTLCLSIPNSFATLKHQSLSKMSQHVVYVHWERSMKWNIHLLVFHSPFYWIKVPSHYLKHKKKVNYLVFLD